MRMILPPMQERRIIDTHLSSFFRDYRVLDFRRAVSLLCKFYQLKRPRIEWYEYLDWGKTAGKTYENGHIHLVHPENWKRGRKYNSERQWINVVYHELGHFIYWTDAERKADTFAYRMVRGLYLRRENAARMLRVISRSVSSRAEDICRTATKKRLATRTVGGSTKGRVVNEPNRKNGKRLPGRSSFGVSRGTTKSKRANI